MYIKEQPASGQFLKKQEKGFFNMQTQLMELFIIVLQLKYWYLLVDLFLNFNESKDLMNQT